MTTLHTMGCSITQGYALPDVVNYEILLVANPKR
jgi:hypothetical protein